MYISEFNIPIVTTCNYVSGWPIPLKYMGLMACGWEGEYRYNIQKVKPVLGSRHKLTVNIILEGKRYPTGFSPMGEFHPDPVNEHA